MDREKILIATSAVGISLVGIGIVAMQHGGQLVDEVQPYLNPPFDCPAPITLFIPDNIEPNICTSPQKPSNISSPQPPVYTPKWRTSSPDITPDTERP